MTTPLPGPPGLPIIGNFNDIEKEVPLRSLEHFADIYGGIYEINIGGIKKVVIGSHEYFSEVCDESRFSKAVQGALVEVRNGVGDGLFTAYPGERAWGIAHRVLMPAFGAPAILGMFDEMHDIASQLVMKWARHGSKNVIPVTEDFTRLTLDTIALCAMDYRFNSYYQEKMHPFVGAMSSFLIESGLRASRPKLPGMSWLFSNANATYEENITLMKEVALGVVKTRRENPTQKKDVLNAMIHGKDPTTGEGLSDESITNNMITFLIAGHETTSGLLSFVFFCLLSHPSAYRAVQAEVDTVCGRDPIKAEHLTKLPYITAVLRETLRLYPTAAIFTLRPKADTKEDPVTLGGNKYAVGKDEPLMAVLTKIHRDPAVYGEDAEDFRPERMMDGNFEKLPKNSWKPFGNGIRACIGRPFAWQESLLVIALLFQNFNFTMDDSSYQLQFKQTLTIKPKGFYIRATLRHGLDPTTLEKHLQESASSSAGAVSDKIKASKPSDDADQSDKKPMTVLYGSWTGTCEALANKLASEAAQHGFKAEVDTLDSAVGNLPKGEVVAIITASYEGLPAPNAQHFVEWLGAMSGNDLEGTTYAVFGCGSREWPQYQRIPKLIDELLEKNGAKRIAEIGAADAAKGNMFTDFDTWGDVSFWPAIMESYGGTSPSGTSASSVQVEVRGQKRSGHLRLDVREGLITGARVLTAPGEPEKRHIEIQLPSESTYKAGDYLAILPINPRANIRRVIVRFGLAWDAVLFIQSSGPTTLPTDIEISAFDILAAYVELAQPATRKNVIALSKAATSEESKAALESLTTDENMEKEITQKRTSVLDLLEKHPSVNLPFGEFLAMLPPMRVRQYSISSSPLCDPTTATVTYSVLEQNALSGSGRYVGVATSHLSCLEPGDRVQISVRPSAQAFHLPLDPSATPIIMICAGTGLAPFRGFVQERAAQLGAGRKLAKALLFIGCRREGADTLYAEEFNKWVSAGAVDIRYAFSKQPENSEGCLYVQDRLWNDRKEVSELFDAGAKVFVCGNRSVGEGVKEVCLRMYKEKVEADGLERTEENAVEWFEKLRNERYVTDVFA